MTALPELGATPAELSSRPGLLLDLATALLPRRVGATRALIAALGAGTADKVDTRLKELDEHIAAVSTARVEHYGPEEVLYAARGLMAAVARLEDSLFALLSARVKHGMTKLPTTITGAAWPQNGR